jgi:hypothetical protein
VKLEPETRDLLQSFKLRPRQKARVWDAYLENPEGLERVALQAQGIGNENGNTGAGLLLTMIERGDHLSEATRGGRRVTGWRFIRGTHSGSYVRDKRGTDPLPQGYGLEA